MESTLVCLVRHGESEWNLERRIQGQLDAKLSSLGEAQAEAVADRLAGERWDRLYSSDLVRALETARRVARRTGLSVLTRPELRERHQGKLQGLSSDEARRTYPDFDAPEVGRESEAALVSRAARAIGRIIAESPGRRVLVVCHGGVIRAYLQHLKDLDPRVTPVNVENTSITKVQASASGFEVVCLNDVAHLEESGLLRPAP